MEILKTILSAAPSIIKTIAELVRKRKERKKKEREDAERKRIEALEYEIAVARERLKQQLAAEIRGEHKNDEYRGSK